MLKTHKDGKVWLVTQPDHAQVSGYLAAHWGNDQFTRPGYFAPVPNAEWLRGQTVLAVAQHDNGWWEWEAAPPLSPTDGFPLGLAEVLKDQQEAMDRWRRGLLRFEQAPYLNLLISYHAYWLYATRVPNTPDSVFAHPLFGHESSDNPLPGENKQAARFLQELTRSQQQWTDGLKDDPQTATWLTPESLNPHIRLLQLLDGLSLALCSAFIPPSSGKAQGLGEDDFELLEVPRQSWQDRIAIKITACGRRRISLKPYPFDQDPLPVVVPVRIFELPAKPEDQFFAWWHSQPLELLTFHYTAEA